MTLKGGRYACAGFELGPSEYYRAWQWVFSDWLPGSGFQPGDSPCFEYYPGCCTQDPAPKMAVEICVPVVPL